MGGEVPGGGGGGEGVSIDGEGRRARTLLPRKKRPLFDENNLNPCLCRRSLRFFLFAPKKARIGGLRVEDPREP